MDAPFPDGMMADIERFFREVHPKLAPGRDLYPAVFQTQHFFPLQRQRELSAMMAIARDTIPEVVMEIGADKGGGLYHWCMCFPTVKRVIACEIRGLPYAELFEKAFPDIDFWWVPGNSHDRVYVSSVEGWLGRDRIDCLFIDGDKLKFVEDFDAYLPRMRDGGVMFMHDVTDREPKKAFAEVCSRGFRTGTIWDTSDAMEALDREENGCAQDSPHEGWLRHWKGRSCGVGVIYV